MQYRVHEGRSALGFTSFNFVSGFSILDAPVCCVKQESECHSDHSGDYFLLPSKLIWRQVGDQKRMEAVSFLNSGFISVTLMNVILC